jgi:hypothetical protein
MVKVDWSFFLQEYESSERSNVTSRLKNTQIDRCGLNGLRNIGNTVSIINQYIYFFYSLNINMMILHIHNVDRKLSTHHVLIYIQAL